tara:strand:- start:329 stop:562 length:234 start_codon:yes stop_codon:yes gene_type:complete
MPLFIFNLNSMIMVENHCNAFCNHSTHTFNFWSVDQIAVGHALKMTQTTLPVYRENGFSVDFKENPMFMRVKQGSLF